MPKHCRILDPLTIADAPKPFGAGGNGSAIFDCIRLLTGTVDIENKATGRVTKLRTCHLTQTTRRLNSTTIDQIIAILFDGDVNKTEADVYLTRSVRDNESFWEAVKAELCLCLVAQKEKKHVNSFLYLFRLLEMVSIPLPLVYASSEPDYRKALRQIKSLSNNIRDADLAILKNFISHIASTGRYGQLKIDFTHKHTDHQIMRKFETQLTNYVFTSVSGAEIKSDDTGFEIPFEEMPSFIATFRNRLFHQRQSEDNLRLDELNGAEEVCATITEPALYWLALVVVEILKVNATRYI